jgi:ABC-type antimicrobial peptide transport system permease subunit
MPIKVTGCPVGSESHAHSDFFLQGRSDTTQRVNIVRLVLRGAFLLVAIGVLIGIPLAIGAGRLMAAQLFEIRSWDPRVFGFSILALGACSAVASVLPASRAASTDPLKALRTE